MARFTGFITSSGKPTSQIRSVRERRRQANIAGVLLWGGGALWVGARAGVGWGFEWGFGGGSVSVEGFHGENDGWGQN